MFGFFFLVEFEMMLFWLFQASYANFLTKKFKEVKSALGYPPNNLKNVEFNELIYSSSKQCSNTSSNQPEEGHFQEKGVQNESLKINEDEKIPEFHNQRKDPKKTCAMICGSVLYIAEMDEQKLKSDNWSSISKFVK
jgi:hypothetical protein